MHFVCVFQRVSDVWCNFQFTSLSFSFLCLPLKKKNKLDLIDENSFGWAQSKSLLDAVCALQHKVSKRNSCNQITKAAFADIYKCYDRVVMVFFMRMISNFYSISGLFYELIKNSIFGTWSQTTVGHFISCWLLQILGLGQGKVTSLLFAAMYINILHYKMRFRELEELISFADDLVIMETGK